MWDFFEDTLTPIIVCILAILMILAAGHFVVYIILWDLGLVTFR